MSTVSSGCHSAPNDMSCMCIGLNITKFHAGHYIIWNMDIVGHKYMRELAMRIELFLTWKRLVLL